MPKKKITNLNEEFDPKLFAIIAKKNFLWIILLVSASLLTSYLYLRYTPATYQAYGIVKLGVVNNASTVLNIQNSEQLNNLGITLFLAGDIELLKSRVILSRVVKSLPLQVSYYAKGTILV